MTGRLVAAIVVIVVGVLAIVVGVIYLTQPAHALPSFFPGHLAHVRAKHIRRGETGIGMGVVLMIGGAWLVMTRTREWYYRES